MTLQSDEASRTAYVNEMMRQRSTPEELSTYDSLTVGGSRFMGASRSLGDPNDRYIDVWATNGRRGHFPSNLFAVAKVLGAREGFLDIVGERIVLPDVAAWSRVSILLGKTIVMTWEDDLECRLYPLYTVHPDGTVEYMVGPQSADGRRLVMTDEFLEHPS